MEANTYDITRLMTHPHRLISPITKKIPSLTRPRGIRVLLELEYPLSLEYCAKMGVEWVIGLAIVST
jgi:hypothetical protein